MKMEFHLELLSLCSAPHMIFTEVIFNVME